MIAAEKTKQPLQINLSRTFIRRVDLSKARLVGADLSFADCTNANFRGADFADAKLVGTILRGADLTDVKNLTSEQLSLAIIDATTILPNYLKSVK
jgi:uncharacterized protein YjbI with pentapeptide repeats